LDTAFDVIVGFMEERSEVRFVGRFTFLTLESKERNAINLKTGEKIIIKAKLVPRVRFSQQLKKKIAEVKLSNLDS